MASASWLNKWRVLKMVGYCLHMTSVVLHTDGAHFIWTALSLNRHRRYHFYDFYMNSALFTQTPLPVQSPHTVEAQMPRICRDAIEHRDSASAFCCHQFVKLRTWFVLSGTIFVCRMPGHLSHSRGLHTATSAEWFIRFSWHLSIKTLFLRWENLRADRNFVAALVCVCIRAHFKLGTCRM